jgi:branched-chain amino acid transport system substrate-binding protein
MRGSQVVKKLLVIPLILVILVASFLGGCGTKEAEVKTLKIGVIWGISGPASFAMIGLKDMALLCADWINQKGGITVNGETYQIECIVEDSKNSPAGAVSAATKLVHDDQVKFIVGSMVPVQVDAIASVTEPNKVLYSAASSDIIHPDRPYSFVASYSLGAALFGIYDVLLELYPEVKTVGYIVEDETGARAAAGLSQDLAKGHGLNVLEPEIHPWETPEYYPQWTKILANKPDAVDIGLKAPDATGACIRHGRELGFEGPLFASVPAGIPLVLSLLPPEFATDYIWPTFNENGPEAPAFVKDELVPFWYEAYPNAPFDAEAVNSWDSVWCLVQAIEKAQSIDPTEVAKAWETMDTLQAAKGTAKMGGAKTFGLNHMVFPPCPITRLKDGQAEFIKWVDPWMP